MKFRALFTRERLEQAALLLLPPLTSFYLMQFILGVLPWELAPGVVLANSLCIGAVYFLLWAATGYPAGGRPRATRRCAVCFSISCAGCGERPTTLSPCTGERRCSPGT